MIRVRFFAAARQAAGVGEMTADGTAGLAGIVADLPNQAVEQAPCQGRGVETPGSRSAELAAVLSTATYLVDGVRTVPDATPLADGCTVDVLPPFSGG